MIVEYDCEQCGKHVRKSRSPANMKNPPRFCSQRCNGFARKGTGSGPSLNHRFECEMCSRMCSVYRPPSAQAPRFCSLQCLGDSQRGSGNPSYSGGRVLMAAGYIWELSPGHPHADCRGYVYEHRRVMERQIGRYLTPEEVVHHRNRVRSDNRPENLQLLASQAEHMRLHREEDRRVAG